MRLDSLTEQIRVLAMAGRDLRAIVRETGQNERVVRSRVRKLVRCGLPIPADADPPSPIVYAVAALAKLGRSRNQIAADLRLSRSAAGSLYRAAIIAGVLTDGPQDGSGLIRAAMSAALEPAASVRGLTRQALAARVLETCAREPALIDNILDDGMYSV